MKITPAAQRVLLTVMGITCGALACGPPAEPASTERRVAAAEALDLTHVRRVGRFEGGRFLWSGSTLEVRFRGSALAIDLAVPASPAHSTHHVSGKPMTLAEPTLPFAVLVDGKRAPDLAVGPARRRYLVVKDLDPAREHRVRVVREAEAKAGVHEVLGVALPEGGELLPPIPRRTRVEVVGDSIACGYGVLGADEKCGFSYATERATRAWPWLVGEAHDSDVTLACWSGRGIRRNYDGTTAETMTDLYFALPPLDPPPQTVLVALGTNDFLSPAAEGADLAPLRVRFRELLVAMRARYPTAHIAAIESPMLPPEPSKRFGPQPLRTLARELFEDVIGELRHAGDVDVSYVHAPHQGNQLGCDWHPNAAMHDAIAWRLKPWLVNVGVLRSE